MGGGRPREHPAFKAKDPELRELYNKVIGLKKQRGREGLFYIFKALKRNHVWNIIKDNHPEHEKLKGNPKEFLKRLLKLSLFRRNTKVIIPSISAARGYGSKVEHAEVPLGDIIDTLHYYAWSRIHKGARNVPVVIYDLIKHMAEGYDKKRNVIDLRDKFIILLKGAAAEDKGYPPIPKGPRWGTGYSFLHIPSHVLEDIAKQKGARTPIEFLRKVWLEVANEVEKKRDYYERMGYSTDVSIHRVASRIEKYAKGPRKRGRKEE